MRLDKYLKVSRLIKRRTVANEACDAGRVLVNDKPAKASVQVKTGDTIEIQFGSKNVKVEVLDVKETVKKEDIKYGYRYTEFKDNKDIIILKARLKLEKGSVQESLELIQDRRERRLKSQPLNYPSAGSVFRNPSKESPAGKLIEEASLKGYRLGGAEVSRLHANFIINVDNAKACDIKELIKVIKDKVKEKDNVDLICEQEILEWK